MSAQSLQRADDVAPGSAVPDDVEPATNVRRVRTITGIVTVVPILSLFFVGWQLWDSLLGWNDIFVFLLLYVLTGLGVTVGFHRLLTHRAFKTTPLIRAALAILGSAAIEGPVIAWVADHRKHHTFSDREGDPHSPHLDHGQACAECCADFCTPTSAGCSSIPIAGAASATRPTCSPTRS